MGIQDYLNGIRDEEERNNSFLHLTANENQLSNTSRLFLDSKINERYYFGGGKNDIVDEGTFIGLGFSKVEQFVNASKLAACEMLNASAVNLNVLSGIHAMMCAILSTTEPGDMVMSVPLEAGGHFCTEGIINRIGRKQVFADYDLENLRFDVERIARKFKETNAKALYLDVSYYLNPHNLKEIREAIGEEPIIIYDASHTLGLIMGQAFQSPLTEGANVISANTHKTFPGPHKGIIAFRDQELADKANEIIDGSLYSTPHISHLIALSTTIFEMKEFGRDYAAQIILNSNVMANEFVKAGYEVRKANTGRFSENHQVHIFIDGGEDRVELYRRLVINNISTNFDSFPLGDRLFIRIGTQEVTRRGMKEEEMKRIANIIDQALKGKNVLEEVNKLNQVFQGIKYSFDAA